MSTIRRTTFLLFTVIAISSGYLFLWTHNNNIYSNINSSSNSNSNSNSNNSNRSSTQPQLPSNSLSINNDNVFFNKNNPLHKKTSLRAAAKRTSLTKVEHDQSKEETIKSRCQNFIQNPPTKIDIVIPYKYQKEDDLSLKYELRSFEKNGLLNHVGTVYILMDTVENADKMKLRYGSYITRQQQRQQQQQKITTAEEDDAAAQVQLHIIAMTELRDAVPFPVEKYEADPKLGKSHYAPYLPGIAEYYLLVPDDVVMLKEYSRDIWFDAEKLLPYGHSFGSWQGGNTHGHPNIAELHGVNFLNRCSLEYVIELCVRGKMKISNPADLSPTAVALGLLNKEHLLSRFYMYHSRGFASVKPHNTEFFRECHTNGGCKSPDGFREIFVNVQGEGVSIEYKEDVALRNRWSEWFEESFPVPSRFEGS